MKLASLKEGRDGKLVLVSSDLRRAIAVPGIALTMQAAIDDWATCAPKLQVVSDRLAAGTVPGGFAFDQAKAHAPLPRAYQWCEGSVYLVHLERTRKSTNRELPPQLYTDPGVYHEGNARTPYLKFGDRFSIECLDDDGHSIFGAMSHTVVKHAA